MLNATYNIYYSPSSKAYVARTMSYALPRVLQGHVDVVMPTTYLGGNQLVKATSVVQSNLKTTIMDEFECKPRFDGDVPSSCGTTITPSCLRALYRTAGYDPKATSKNQLGVVGYLEQYANCADLQVRFPFSSVSRSLKYDRMQVFFAKYRRRALGAQFTTTLVNGGLDDQTKPGIEARVALVSINAYEPSCISCRPTSTSSTLKPSPSLRPTFIIVRAVVLRSIPTASPREILTSLIWIGLISSWHKTPFPRHSRLHMGITSSL
jgi:hypothetical protein